MDEKEIGNLEDDVNEFDIDEEERILNEFNKEPTEKWYNRLFTTTSFKMNKVLNGKVVVSIGFITIWHFCQLLYLVLFIINIIENGIADWVMFMFSMGSTGVIDISIIIFCSLFSIENQTGVGALIHQAKKILKKKEPIAIRMKRLERFMDNASIQWDLLNQGAPAELKALRRITMLYTKNSMAMEEKMEKIGEELTKVLDLKIGVL